MMMMIIMMMMGIACRWSLFGALLMSHIHGHFAESIVWKIYVAFKSKICHRHRQRHRRGEIVNRCGSFNLTKCASLASLLSLCGCVTSDLCTCYWVCDTPRFPILTLPSDCWIPVSQTHSVSPYFFLFLALFPISYPLSLSLVFSRSCVYEVLISVSCNWILMHFSLLRHVRKRSSQQILVFCIVKLFNCECRHTV